MTDIDKHLLTLLNLGFHEMDLSHLRFRIAGHRGVYKITFVSALDSTCCYIVRLVRGEIIPWIDSQHHVIKGADCPHSIYDVSLIKITDMWEE